MSASNAALGKPANVPAAGPHLLAPTAARSALPSEGVVGRVEHGVTRVRLAPMSQADFGRFLVEHAEEYARQKTRAGLWREDEALARSRSELAWLAAGDRASHRFLVAFDEATGERVADVWVGPGPEPAEGVLYLYQVTVREDARGRGLGAATLAAIEAMLRREGVRALRLNVFCWNEAAIRMYERAGYVVEEGDDVAQRMCKRLA